MKKKDKLVYVKEGNDDKTFSRGINLFMVITILALFGLFIALNNMVNAQTELKMYKGANTLYQDRIAELNNELSQCNLMTYNNCTGYQHPIVSINVTVDRVK